jgi:hypothetical protein
MHWLVESAEEKNQKTFIFWRNLQHIGHGLNLSAGAGAKVFWFFSSEKNILSSELTDFTRFLFGWTLRTCP